MPPALPSEKMKPVAAARLFEPATLDVSQAHMTEMGMNLAKREQTRSACEAGYEAQART